MLISQISAVIFFLLFSTANFSQDLEGCQDHPLFLTRIPDYFLAECSSHYDSVVFDYPSTDIKMNPQQGIKTFLRYDFNFESMEEKSTCARILEVFESTAKGLGTINPFAHRDPSVRIWKLIKPSGEISWIKVECGGDDANDYYSLTIIERAW